MSHLHASEGFAANKFRHLADTFADNSLFVIRILASSLFEPENSFTSGFY
ncbi:MAG: hypothetical protein WA705_03825 [Candidatus Ozemobacteraceae bacterium]